MSLIGEVIKRAILVGHSLDFDLSSLASGLSFQLMLGDVIWSLMSTPETEECRAELSEPYTNSLV